jgi:hypothetical protein
MAEDKIKQELWVAWTHDALGAYTEPEDIENGEDLVDDMADAACGYADAMLEEYTRRFSGGATNGTSRRRRSKKKKKPELDPDDDDDDD